MKILGIVLMLLAVFVFYAVFWHVAPWAVDFFEATENSIGKVLVYGFFWFAGGIGIPAFLIFSGVVVFVVGMKD